MTFLSEASEALLFFLGFRGPFSTNLFTPGGNDFWQGSFFILCFFLTAEDSDALLSRSLMIWQNKTMFWYRGHWTQIGYLKKWNSAYLHKCILINVIKWCLSKIWVPNQCKTLCYTDFPRTRNPEPRMGKWRGFYKTLGTPKKALKAKKGREGHKD